MSHDEPERARAFLTCSSRAERALAPLLSSCERLLHDLGWRTRVPRRAGSGALSLADRRRLRAATYREVERAELILHVPAPARLAGTTLHRELHHATESRRPVLLLELATLREELGIEAPAAARLRELGRLTGGELVQSTKELKQRLDGARHQAPGETSLPRARAEPTATA